MRAGGGCLVTGILVLEILVLEILVLEILVLEILVLEILVPRPKILAGNRSMVHLLKNWSGLKTLILGLLSQTREYEMTASQRRVSLVTLNAPGEISNKTKLL